MGKWISWSNDLALGIDEIDEQHKVLVEILNDVYETVNSGVRDEKKLKKIVDGMLRYVGPQASGQDAFLAAVQERVQYRLAEYFELRFERKNVFNVINAGEDRGIIMLGADEAAGLQKFLDYAADLGLAPKRRPVGGWPRGSPR